MGKDYQVRIQSTSKPTIKDTGNNYFSIVANTDSAGSITVTSPNGGGHGNGALRTRSPGTIQEVPVRQ